MRWKSRLSRVVLALLVGCFVIGSGCATRNGHPLLRKDLQGPEGFPKLLAVYMPWFGDQGHAQVGYSSQDPAVLSRQIDQARSVGVSGFVVDWYGQREPFLDQSFALLQEIAVQKHFQVALMYDEGDDEQATEETLEDLDRAYESYIGPNAPAKSAYLTYNGRPVIFIFPKAKTDWSRVRAHVDKWVPPPLLFYKDEAPAQFESSFDGYYPWVHPGPRGWSPDGSDWGKDYLEAFYKKMKEKHPDKVAVGAAWPGFDDTGAPWSLNRHMAARCGKTLEETLHLYHQYSDESRPLPFLLVETWNDYEEGTAIERQAFRSCGPGK